MSHKGSTQGYAYRRLAHTAFNREDFKTALEYFELELRTAIESGEREEEGESYCQTGLTYQILRDFQKSIQFCQQGLSIAKELGNKELEAKMCTSIGEVYGRMGDIASQIEYNHQALSIAKEIQDKFTTRTIYANLGNAYYSFGDFEKAIEIHLQGISIAKEGRSNEEELDLGEWYSNIGLAYYSLNDFENAIKFHQEALSIAKIVGKKNNEEYAYLCLGKSYMNLALICFSRCEFAKAIEMLNKALSIAKQFDHKDMEAMAYNDMGSAYNRLGDFKTGVELLKQALRISRKIRRKDMEGFSCQNLGYAYYSLGDLEKAMKFYQQALDIAQKSGKKATESQLYSDLGLSHASLCDFEKAIAFYQKALSISEEAGNREVEVMAKCNLGMAYFSLGDSKKAIEFYKQALSIPEEGEKKDIIGRIYVNLGIAYHRLGDFSTAEEFLKSSVRIFDEIRNLQTNDDWKISLRDQYETAYSCLRRIQLQQDNTVGALFTAERGLGQALTDLMESRYGLKLPQPVEEEMILFETLSSISRHITSLTLFITEDRDSVIAWIWRKRQHFGKCQFLRKETDSNMDILILEAYEQIGVFESVMCENRSLDAESEELEDLPDRNTDESDFAASEGKSVPFKVLSDVLFECLYLNRMMFFADPGGDEFDMFLGTGDEVVIVPVGPLFLVPYPALADKDLGFLCEHVRVRLVPTLTSLKLLAECPKAYHSTSGALLVGDPWVETVRFRRRKVKQLPSARKEVEMIGRILNVEPLIGKYATKAEVLQRLNSVALVHIAAHGSAKAGEILLSPNPTNYERPKEEDFLLTMSEVLEAKVRAQLVVLSCCHSGRGKVKAEGVVGIARAFLGAGARSVIASLWAIDDEATLEFMRHFYKHLITGQSAGESLNHAMEWMRESDSYSAVKYWAPFVLIGDDVTLEFRHFRLGYNSKVARIAFMRFRVFFLSGSFFQCTMAKLKYPLS